VTFRLRVIGEKFAEFSEGKSFFESPDNVMSDMGSGRILTTGGGGRGMKLGDNIHMYIYIGIQKGLIIYLK